jgi:hypothetical protein
MGGVSLKFYGYYHVYAKKEIGTREAEKLSKQDC